MKLMRWQITVDAETHTVIYSFSRLAGKQIVSIDGDSFDLPAGILGLRAARREIFRLGDEQAILAVDKKGRAELIFRAEIVVPVQDSAE